MHDKRKYVKFFIFVRFWLDKESILQRSKLLSINKLSEQIKALILGLREEYGVNPIIFGSIYLGAISFFTLSVAWLIKNYLIPKLIILPAFAATGCFISAYIYLMIVGRNVPRRVYAVAVVVISYGVWSVFKTIYRKNE